MDASCRRWYFPDMPPDPLSTDSGSRNIPAWNLYGERRAFPDVLHIERITDRAAGLDWRIAPHRHPHLHQFFLILDGAAKVTLDGIAPDVVPPFLLSVPPGVVHGFSFAAGTDGHVLTVPLQSLPELLDAGAAQGTALGRVGILTEIGALEPLFRRIHAEHDGSAPARGVMLRALAAEVACLVLRALDGPVAESGATADPRFHRFQAALNQHLRDGWRLADHARAIGISERHLSRICRAATGQPAAALIEAALMREACRLLVYTRASIASVGYDLGFEDPSYFSRAFRRVMGLSPGAYRAGFERD